MTRLRVLFFSACALMGSSLPGQVSRAGIEAGPVTYCSAQVVSWWRGLGNGGRFRRGPDVPPLMTVPEWLSAQLARIAELRVR